VAAGQDREPLGICCVLQGIARRVSRSFLHRGCGHGLILSCSSEFESSAGSQISFFADLAVSSAVLMGRSRQLHSNSRRSARLVGLVQRVEPTVLQICLLVNHKQVDDAAPEPGRSLKATASRPA